jgi:hypothetical protein
VDIRVTPVPTQAVPTEAPGWALAPSAARVYGIDAALRQKLASSLAYLADAASLHSSHHADLTALEDRLLKGPVSPWVFCLYSKLVADLAKAVGDVGAGFAEISSAAALPADGGVVPLRSPAFPVAWWDHAGLLFDTDQNRNFKPKAPTDEAFTLCEREIEAGLSVLKRADAGWHQEVKSLLKMIMVGAPAGPDPDSQFNGASTFFFWGAPLINGNTRRDSLFMVDVLIHESSHILLFGLSADGALTDNSGHERHDSPLRPDERPVDGIFHAGFVATRVHLAMSRMLASGALSDEERELAAERAYFNGDAARTALKQLDEHARPTELGSKILDTLRAYWCAVPAS